MANWEGDFVNATVLSIERGSIEYYKSVTAISPIGTLKPGTVIYVNYDKEKDAMKITMCEKQSGAVGMYLKKPTNKAGKIVVNLVSTRRAPTTTEAKTTTDSNGNTVPENTTVTTDPTTGDTTVNTSGSGTNYSSIADETVYIDDAFLESVAGTIYTSSQEYYNNLQDGLRVQDLRGILGMPHQFLPTADPRIDNSYEIGDSSRFGRVYAEKIIKHIPLLLMTPGTPTFMAKYTSDQQSTVLGTLFNLGGGASLDSVFNDGRIGKYYSLKYAYTEYFYYVNAMLRSAAIFLDIQDEKIDGTTLETMNWLYKTTTLSQSTIYSHGNLANFLGPYAGSVAFYADAGTTVDDSFGNSTTESQLASALNNLSDTGREVNFLIGNIGGMAGVNLNALTGADDIGATVAEAQKTIDDLLGGGGVMSSILGKATTILAGGRIIFPEIWSDSSFSRSYSCSMKLVSPSGDKLSVFLNILVPIYHLLAFTLPRESTNQAYFSPFLVRAYYKGLFNVDMGIIPGLSITKGEEGEWTLDGIPTVANINFEIKDLYQGLYMSKQQASNDYGILSNIQELDYIANSCGVNVNDQEIQRTLRMAVTLGFTTNIADKITIGIFGEVSQFFNQKMQNIFGVFK